MAAYVKAFLESQSLRLSFIGNVAGRVWQGVLSLLAVPIFIQLLGNDSFGIVSFVQSLQALLSFLDMGLAATVNREVAVRRCAEDREEVADIVRTFEWVYWPVALVVAVAIAGVSGWLSTTWMAKQTLSPANIQIAVILGGITLAARWPVALYTGVLRGLERQVLLNVILMAAATARLVVGVAAVMLYSRTVYCFLISQAVVNSAEALATGYFARELTDPSCRGRFRAAELRRVWRFALSFNLVGAFGTLAYAADKMLISKLLPISAMTYYSVCATATGVLLLVYQAAAVSLFPRMSYYGHRGELTEMSRLYLLCLRVSTYLCLGPSIVLCFFPKEVLFAWTRSEDVARAASTLLPVMTAAIMLNCFSALTYTILIATGRTRLPLILNLALLPANWICTYAAIERLGLVGAAWCTVAVNAIYFLAYGIFFRNQILRDGSLSLCFGLPLRLIGVAVTCGVAARLAAGEHGTTLRWAVSAAVATVVFYAAGLGLMSSQERRLILGTFQRTCEGIMRVMRPRQAETFP